MRPSVSYILYSTSSHEQTGDIITFANFEEHNLEENEHNAEEDESISDSMNELSMDDDYDDGYICTNAIKNIWDGSQIHPEIKKNRC